MKFMSTAFGGDCENPATVAVELQFEPARGSMESP
jgi:hypothetical protein